MPEMIHCWYWIGNLKIKRKYSAHLCTSKYWRHKNSAVKQIWNRIFYQLALVSKILTYSLKWIVLEWRIVKESLSSINTQTIFHDLTKVWARIKQFHHDGEVFAEGPGKSPKIIRNTSILTNEADITNWFCVPQS